MKPALLILLILSPVLALRAQLSILGDIQGPLTDIRADSFSNNGFYGKGINIGVIDVGFEKLGQNPGLNHIIHESRLRFARNYLHRAMEAGDTLTRTYLARVPQKDLPVFKIPWKQDAGLYDTNTLFTMGNTHGSLVTWLIAGIPGENARPALGKEGNYFLAKTEFGKKDHRLEEHLLGQALEDFYQRQVQVVNISLGYRSNFALEDEAYQRESLDGKSALSSSLCNAYADKGLIIVVAAGNEGFKSWKAIAAPGDADQVITVGSTRAPGSILKAWFSSIGEGSRVKPDVCCYSATGTSLSAPVITGLVAAMLQKDSTLSPKQVKELLQKSATLYPYPNTFVGYGVPDAGKIWQMMKGEPVKPEATLIQVQENELPVELEAKRIECFHKSDPVQVIKQEELTAVKGRLLLQKPKGAKFTTLVLDMKKVIEIEWQ